MKYVLKFSLVCLLLACNNRDSEDNVKVLGKDNQHKPDVTDPVKEANLTEVKKDTVLQKEPLPGFTSNGLRFKLLENNVQGEKIRQGDVVRFKYSLKAPNGELIQSSVQVDPNYSLVQGLSFVPPVLDKAFLNFKEGDQFKLKVPALHPEMQEFKPGVFSNTDTLTYEIEILDVPAPFRINDNIKVYPVKKGSGTDIENDQIVGLEYFGFLDNGDGFITSRTQAPVVEIIMSSPDVHPVLKKIVSELRVGDRVYVKIPAQVITNEHDLFANVPADTDVVLFITIHYLK